MKFFALVGLFAGAQAVRIAQSHSKSLIKLRHKSKQGGEGEQGPWNDVEAFVRGELADGGTITKDEAYNAISGIADKYGFEMTEEMWDELEAEFDATDANGDGELDEAEVKAAWEEFAGDQEPEDVQPPSQQQVVDWIEKELAKDGDITKKEAYDAVAGWADANGVVISDEEWDMMEAGFDMIDGNGDGALTRDEIDAAFAEHGPPEEAQLKLRMKSKSKVAHKAKALLKAKAHTKFSPKKLIKMRIREPECPDLTAEEEEQIADAVNGMPDDLEITGQDYLDYMEANEIELTEKEMAEAEEMFHLIDTDGNGAHSKDELLHAIDMYEEHCK